MARFWEGTLTYKENGTGETKVKNVKLVSNDIPGAPITNNTKFFDIKDAYNGFDVCCTTPIRLVEITEETEEDVKRVDYNKRKFGPVTVKNYSLDYVGSSEYDFESTLQSVEEYDTQNVPLDELISASRSAIGSIPCGARIFIIDGDVLVDGKTYWREGDFSNELGNYDYGSVNVDENGEIYGFSQATLTGYDMTNEMFDSNEGGKVISIISVATQC